MSDARAAISIPDFVVVDFETATADPDSACAIGAVIVENGIVVRALKRLIRPPTDEISPFNFRVHGIHPTHWVNEPQFPEVWEQIASMIGGTQVLAAHNAGFDQRVLSACCASYGIAPPDHDFVCTLEAASALWPLESYALPRVCQFLGIPLNHHDAQSDAAACAAILLRAMAGGFKPLTVCTGDSAVRLQKELSGEVMKLVSSIMEDGAIEPAEIDWVARWFAANPDAASVWPGSELNRRVTAILRDGAVVDEELDDIRELCVALLGIRERKKARRATKKPPGTLSVCFTGFGAVTAKAALRKEAEASGFHVASGITKTLDYLVCGPEPGPAKEAEARERGVKVVDLPTWRTILETPR